MPKFTPGTIAVMKTTDEPGFVLDVIEGEFNFPHLSGEQVVVRRPVLTANNGLTYVIETFYAEEFDTQEDRQATQRNRRIQEMQETQSALGLTTASN